MECLSHNQVIRITLGPRVGIYRVLFDEPSRGQTMLARISVRLASSAANEHADSSSDTDASARGARPASDVGVIVVEREELVELDKTLQLQRVEVEPEAIYLLPLEKASARRLYELRLRAMQAFLDVDRLQEQILVHDGLGGLIKEAMRRTGVSRAFVYKCWGLLCRHGFSALSLRPRYDRCGARGVRRPCDPGGRKKAGRKTYKQRIAAYSGVALPDGQPGMSTEWTVRIIAADKAIPNPKPSMRARCIAILRSHFVRRYRDDGKQLIEIELNQGEYPNVAQIERVLKTVATEMEWVLQKTTQGHFTRSQRGAGSRSYKGVQGPGHTWAIDSTVGDIYLRSSVNRSWIIGRPIVYILVDVWSTAVSGFYVCLQGPSWPMAKLSLFSSAAPPQLIADLWGYVPVLSLAPSPTLPAVLLCDRGEYLSRAAAQTGLRLLPILSYTPPYRPELKGLVEVLHRIGKDEQFLFVPGAIDARRKEYELRRTSTATAIFTVRDYVQYLTTIFTRYNLCADRSKRLDAHMQAAGVFPSPAGLWRWGHEVGIGFRRHVPKAELVSSLLMAADARVSRTGVRMFQREYTHPQIQERHWIDIARNLGGWSIPTHYFPGSVSRIWTPDLAGSGMLELLLSDHSTASEELTVDEAVDAFAFQACSSADVEHRRRLGELAAEKDNKALVARASELTAQALEREKGPTPTIREARQEDIAASQFGPATTAPVERPETASLLAPTEI